MISAGLLCAIEYANLVTGTKVYRLKNGFKVEPVGMVSAWFRDDYFSSLYSENKVVYIS